ncbi:mitochondrial substrate carrier family protein [Musa troglodytarum]|uniref:Mitochondrial substrate carrier family protein n=1 Tax=Musa troglodytarum TaxID=320322 RepID=A0A9E7L8C2_9LILI|nr:mitochondrial substrate carrier family protein [Musa troglodytarum]
MLLEDVENCYTDQQAFKASRAGGKPPGIRTTLLGVLSPSRSNNHLEKRAQLARDVPFSAICWSTLEPIRRRLLGLVGEDGNAASVLGANFLAGYVAGSLAAAVTCPLDVAKTRRQIEKDPERMLKTTTRQTIVEVWRREGAKGLFTGVGPRVGRAGPSVGIVVSFMRSSSIFCTEGRPPRELSTKNFWSHQWFVSWGKRGG